MHDRPGASPMSDLATTVEPPYYAVIFTSMDGEKNAAYAETARRMLELAAQQPGFLGVDSCHEGEKGITVSYWRDEAAIKAWRNHVEHMAAQEVGRATWYRDFSVRVARVERASRR